MIIYLITNTLNGKQYVGQTIKSLELRWRRHCWNVTANTSGMPISAAIAKYGRENFTIKVLANASSQEELDDLEVAYCESYGTMSPGGYNLRAGNARGKCSEETKLKISKSNKGKICTAEARKNLSKAHMGLPMSDSARAKRKALYKGRSVSTLGPTASAAKLAKTYTLRSPDGAIITFVNMRAFCALNNLSPSKMCLVVQGKRNHHKGWGVCKGVGENTLGKLLMQVRSELCNKLQSEV